LLYGLEGVGYAAAPEFVPELVDLGFKGWVKHLCSPLRIVIFQFHFICYIYTSFYFASFAVFAVCFFFFHRKGRKDRKDCARLVCNANTELFTARLFEIVLVFFQVSPEKPL